MMRDRYFLEIGIYRIDPGTFNAQYDRALREHLKQHERNYAKVGLEFTRERRLPIEDYFWKSFGGPWEYNQSVGWLRLYASSSQIGADLWISDARRFQRRMARRQLFLHGKAFELGFERTGTSAAIAAELRRELERFQSEFREGRMVLGMECFDTVAAHQLEESGRR